MSYELQIAAEAKNLVDKLADRVALIEEHLGDDLKELAAEHEANKIKAAQMAAPIELTDAEKKAILDARIAISAATAAKNAPAS